MIDNPLPDQIMQEKEMLQNAQDFEFYCFHHAKEIAEHYKVHEVLHEYFQEWYHDYYSNKPEEMPNVISAEDVDLINTWWDMGADAFDNYDSPYLILGESK